MSESVTPTGGIARNTVTLNTAEEIAFWTRKWGITREQLQQAVDRAGGKEARVANYLLSKGFIRF